MNACTSQHSIFFYSFDHDRIKKACDVVKIIWSKGHFLKVQPCIFSLVVLFFQLRVKTWIKVCLNAGRSYWKNDGAIQYWGRAAWEELARFTWRPQPMLTWTAPDYAKTMGGSRARPSDVKAMDLQQDCPKLYGRSFNGRQT